MSILQRYEPKVGDIICWKGFKKEEKWVMTENLIFPALLNSN